MVLWTNSHQIRLVIRDESNSSLVWMGLQSEITVITQVLADAVSIRKKYYQAKILLNLANFELSGQNNTAGIEMWF